MGLWGKTMAGVVCSRSAGAGCRHRGCAAPRMGVCTGPGGMEAGAPILRLPPCLGLWNAPPPAMPWDPAGERGASLAGMAPGQPAARAHGSFAGGEVWPVGAEGTRCHPTVRVHALSRQCRKVQAGVLSCPGQVPGEHGLGRCPSLGPWPWACGRPRRAPPSLPAPSDLWPGEARGADRLGHKTGAGSRPTSKAARGCGRNNSGDSEHRAVAPTPWHPRHGTDAVPALGTWVAPPCLPAPHTCTLCPPCASHVCIPCASRVHPMCTDGQGTGLAVGPPCGR